MFVQPTFPGSGSGSGGQGPQGPTGPAGATGAAGADGADGAPGADGADGASAYDIAVAEGFVGDEAAWLASLVGADGADGAPGAPGADGADGSDATVTDTAIAAALGFTPANVTDVLNSQTGTTYTLDASDNGKVVELNNAAAITVTVPNSLAVGFNCILSQTGAGLVTVVAGSGATVNAFGGLKSPGQWGEMSLRVRANSGGSSALAVLGGGVA